MSVLLPSSTLPQVMKPGESGARRPRDIAAGCARPAARTRWCREGASEIPLLLLPLHRGRRIVIDQPALALGRRRDEYLLDNGFEGLGLALDRAGERVAAERAKADLPHPRTFAGLERHALVVDHDQRAVARDHRTRLGEVERHDGNRFLIDVLPDVELGPVGQRKHADALALVRARVVEVPELRALLLRIPPVLGRTEGEDALLGAALFLVAARPAERRVEAPLRQRLLEALRLHDIGMDRRAMDERIDGGRDH